MDTNSWLDRVKKATEYSNQGEEPRDSHSVCDRVSRRDEHMARLRRVPALLKAKAPANSHEVDSRFRSMNAESSAWLPDYDRHDLYDRAMRGECSTSEMAVAIVQRHQQRPHPPGSWGPLLEAPVKTGRHPH